MSIGRREAILTRLAVILAETRIELEAVTFVRNRGPLSTDKRPAVYLFDGDERARDTAPGRNGGRSVWHPQRVIMTPEIWFVLADRRRTEDTTQGTLVNAARDVFITAIINDATLRSLLVPPSEIIYRGCSTDLKTGFTFDGQMRIDLEFHYVFDPPQT